MDHLYGLPLWDHLYGPPLYGPPLYGPPLYGPPLWATSLWATSMGTLYGHLSMGTLQWVSGHPPMGGIWAPSNGVFAGFSAIFRAFCRIFSAIFRSFCRISSQIHRIFSQIHRIYRIFSQNPCKTPVEGPVVGPVHVHTGSRKGCVSFVHCLRYGQGDWLSTSGCMLTGHRGPDPGQK